MRTHTGRPAATSALAARLVAAGALLALGACAEAGSPPRPLATISPLELVGLPLQSVTPDRILGTIDDVVVTPNREPVQVVVASGSPVYPVKRWTVLDTGNVRYSSERQALLLTGMTPDDFAALPPVRGPGAGQAVPGLLPAPFPAPLPGTPDATNWYRATSPGPR